MASKPNQTYFIITKLNLYYLKWAFFILEKLEGALSVSIIGTSFDLPNWCLEPEGFTKNFALNRIISIPSSFQEWILDLFKNKLT